MEIIWNKTHSGNIQIKFADHFSQFLSINKEITKLNRKIIYKHDFQNVDKESFINDISIQNWAANNPIRTNPKFDDFLWRINKYILKMITHHKKIPLPTH